MSKHKDINDTFVGFSLACARQDAQLRGIPVPKLTTWTDGREHGYKYYEVWADGQLVWRGEAWNACEAKAKHISRLVDLHDRAIEAAQEDRDWDMFQERSGWLNA